MNEEIKIEGNQDIQAALREFEAKSAGEPNALHAAAMPDVSPEIPKMVRWVMKISGGAITGQKQAEYVLFGFVVVAIGISFYLFFGRSSKTSSVDKIKVEKKMQLPAL